MPGLVISKFDQIPIANKVAHNLGHNFPHNKGYGKIFHGSRASNSEVNDLTWPKFQLV